MAAISSASIATVLRFLPIMGLSSRKARLSWAWMMHLPLALRASLPEENRQSGRMKIWISFPFWHELRNASAGWHSCLLACYLEVGSSNKASLGPYQDILARDMVASQKLSDEHEFEELPNRDILKRMSVCGRSPNFFISWGRRYYYCIPHMGYDWFSISELGHLDKDVMESFFQARPIVKEIQKMSIFDVLDKYRSSIKKNVLKEIESMRERIRFAGCSVCLRLCREGVL